MIGSAISAIAAEHFRRRAEAAERQISAIHEAREDMARLNMAQSAYRDWATMPQFVKFGGHWLALVDYPPSVPRVR